MIELSIDRENCPETSANRTYEEYMRWSLDGEENEELERKIELLYTFLISADFRKLRCEAEKISFEREKRNQAENLFFRGRRTQDRRV